MKKLITLMAIILAVTLISVLPSYAGSRKDEIKKFLFPIPVPIIIYTERSRDRNYDRNYRPRQQRRHYKSNRRRLFQSGHWEYKRVWTGAVYERIWIDGRYRRVVLREGYYVETRIWVDDY